ncbi:hypothetical protein PHMEG_00033440, partial [Phytophthora megakarya]
DIGDDPANLHTQVLQLRAERNDFEHQTISTREDLRNAVTDRDRLRLEASQAGDVIRDLQEHVRGLERETDDARSESATALASYNRISSSLTRTQPDHGRDPSLGSTTRLVQAHRDHALADLALARETLTQVTFDRDRAFKQLAQTTEDRIGRLSIMIRSFASVIRRLLNVIRESQMTDLQVAHDQLAELRDLAGSDLNEADVLLTHLTSRIRESPAARIPKRERSPPSSPPQLPPLKTPRSDRPVSPPPNQDQPEIEDPEDQEHQDQPEIKGPEDQEHQDQPEIEGPEDQELKDKPELFTAAEIHRWDPIIVGTVPTIAMIQATLTERMLIPPNFLFPFRNPLIRAPIPVTGYHSELITATFTGELRPLCGGSPCRMPPSADPMIAYWESTHYLEITSVMTDADSNLFTYHQDQPQWANFDILLDPYFLHLPTKQDRVRWYPGSVSRTANLTQPTTNLPEPTDLITALFECDQADPWRNHYRDLGSAHPSLSIPRLGNKFNPPAAH